MPNIRSLRLSRGMTLVELALEAGIPARTLGAIEHGQARLDAESAARLATSLGVAAEMLYTPNSPATGQVPNGGVGWLSAPVSRFRPAASLLVAALISVLLFQALLWRPALVGSVPVTAPLTAATALTAIPTSAPQRRSAPTPPVSRPRGVLAVLAISAPPTRTVAPPTDAPQPTPAFWLDVDGPHGCPLVADGRVMITQGYGEGTHAPAAIWGALDLAVDGDGDGIPEPDATDGVLVIATHAGVARVFPMSWPGGNFVLVEDAQSGWTTAYAHLAVIDVADGQSVEAGAPLGTVGSTGQATGPHLHYEVRYAGVNLDPSGLLACWG